MMRKSSALRDALLLLAVQCVVFLPVLVMGGVLLPVADSAAPPWTGAPSACGQDFAGTDRAVFSWPNWQRIGRTGLAQSGDLLHNQQILCGTPFLGTLDTAVFSFTTVLLWLLPLASAVLASAILHGWIAGLTARLALRCWVKDDRAVLLGAALFSTTPWFIGHQDVFPFVESAAWAPLILHGAWQLARHGRASGFLTLPLGFAFSFFGGLPQLTLVTATAAGLLAVGALVGSWRETPVATTRRRALFTLGAMAIGLALTLPVLLPGFAMSKNSGRAAITADELKASAMRPLELTGWFVPDLLGAPARLYEGARPDAGFLPPEVTEHNHPIARKAGLSLHGASHIERLCGVSALGTLCACLALLTFRDRRVRWAALFAAAGLLLALATPLLDLLLSIPGFSFGSARRWIFWTVLGSSALAAFGLEAALQSAARRRLVSAAAVALAFPLLCIGMAVCGPEFLKAILDDKASLADDSLVAAMPRWVLVVTVPVALFMAAGAIALSFPRWTTAALLVLIATEGMFLQATLNPAQEDATPFEETATITKLRALTHAASPVPGAPWRIARFRSETTDVPEARGRPMALPSNLGMLHGLYDIHGYEGMLRKDYETLLECAEPGVAVAHHLIREFHAPDALQHGVLDLLGARWILSSGQLPLPLVEAFPSELCAIYENPGAQPIVQMPRRLEVLADDHAVLGALKAKDYRPEEAAFINAADAAGITVVPAPVPEGTSLPLLRVHFDSTLMEIHFEHNPVPRPLLIAVCHDAHWTASDGNGARLPLVRADQALMLTVIPAGAGVVRIEYGHADVNFGAMLSLLAIACMLLGWRVLHRGTESLPC